MSAREPTHRELLALAVPLVLSNLTVPVLGVVDTGVAGHLPEPTALAAVSAAGAVSSVVLLGFNFLRMSTTGLVAQAHGREDATGARTTLARAALLALALALALVAVRQPIAAAGIGLVAPPGAVAPLAEGYLHVRLLGAPFTLLGMVGMGFFLGHGRAGVALAMTVAANLANIGLDLLLVPGWGWGVEGLAWATVGGEAAAVLVAAPFLASHLARDGGTWDGAALRDTTAWRALLSANGDLLLRTLLLTGTFAAFTRQVGFLGEVALAANAVLLQLQAILSYGLDGFANAAEVLVGRAIGRRDRAATRRAVGLALGWSGAIALTVSAAFAVGGGAIVAALTDLPDVRAVARTLLPWMVLSPLVSVWAFTYDGVFIGAHWTRPMRDSVIVGAATFAIGVLALQGPLGHHGLWVAFLGFLAVRGAWLALAWRRRRPAASEGA